MGRPTGPIGLTRAFVSWAGSGWPFLDPGWPIGRLARIGGRNFGRKNMVESFVRMSKFARRQGNTAADHGEPFGRDYT